jgi:hypothetical protein
VKVVVKAGRPQPLAEPSNRVARGSGGITATSATKSASEFHVDVLLKVPEHPVLNRTFPLVMI